MLAIYLTVGLSVFAHGLSAAPLANRYARWYERHPRDNGTGDGERPRRSDASAGPQGGRDMTGEPDRSRGRATPRSCSSTDSRPEPSSRAGWSARSSDAAARAPRARTPRPGERRRERDVAPARTCDCADRALAIGDLAASVAVLDRTCDTPCDGAVRARAAGRRTAMSARVIGTSAGDLLVRPRRSRTRPWTRTTMIPAK